MPDYNTDWQLFHGNKYTDEVLFFIFNYTTKIREKHDLGQKNFAQRTRLPEASDPAAAEHPSELLGPAGAAP